MKHFDLRLIAPVDLTPSEVQDIQSAFEAEDIALDVKCAYFVKSAEQQLANFVVEFAKEAEAHGIDKFLGLLCGALGAGIVNAFKAVRKRLHERKVQVRIHFETPHVLSYILPQPPDFERAIQMISEHRRSLPPDAKGDVFWYEGAWITSAKYWDLVER